MKKVSAQSECVRLGKKQRKVGDERKMSRCQSEQEGLTDANLAGNVK